MLLALAIAAFVGLVWLFRAFLLRGEGSAPLPPPRLDAHTPGDSSAAARIHELVVRGHKIEAIKLYREEHGVGLREAKDAIDSLLLRG